jgi:hypothetical protein
MGCAADLSNLLQGSFQGFLLPPQHDRNQNVIAQFVSLKNIEAKSEGDWD